jgi:hypothetical protein
VRKFIFYILLSILVPSVFAGDISDLERETKALEDLYVGHYGMTLSELKTLLRNGKNRADIDEFGSVAFVREKNKRTWYTDIFKLPFEVSTSYGLLNGVLVSLELRINAYREESAEVINSELKKYFTAVGAKSITEAPLLRDYFHDPLISASLGSQNIELAVAEMEEGFSSFYLLNGVLYELGVTASYNYINVYFINKSIDE